jgi:hypothetical protein
MKTEVSLPENLIPFRRWLAMWAAQVHHPAIDPAIIGVEMILIA